MYTRVRVYSVARARKFKGGEQQKGSRGIKRILIRKGNLRGKDLRSCVQQILLEFTSWCNKM